MYIYIPVTYAVDRRTWTSPDARCVMAVGTEGTAVFTANG